MNNIELRTRVLLSIQSSLLGVVSPSMVGVSCRWTENSIWVYFILDRCPDEAILDDISCFETELISHFPDFDVTVECRDYSELNSYNEFTTWVYRRKQS